MRTTADEARDRAINSVQAAIRELSSVVVERCPGWEDFEPEYQNSLKQSLQTLIEVRDILDV